MPSSGYSLRAHVVESLTAIKRPDVPLQVVLRNTFAVVLPLGAGFALGYPQAGLGVAAGALNTMFADQPGPYHQRMRQLLLTSLVAALAALVGFLIGGRLVPMLLATALSGFVGGLLVLFGTNTARVGMTSMILLVVTASTPTTLLGAVQGAALIFAGGLLLTSFSLAAWPLQRYRPERLALAEVYAGLAALARQQHQHGDDAPALSETMTELQQTLLGRHRSHGRAMEAFGVLLELAERIRLELTALGELHADPAVHAGFRHDSARVLEAIAHALEQGESPRHALRAVQTMRESERSLLESGNREHGLGAHIQALSGQLAAAVRNTDWAGSRGELRASAAETELPTVLRSESVVASLRANLTPHSVAFRHAVRMAVCFSVALWISRQWQLPHGYWLPMTAAIVLRADFAATFKFGLLRIIGTILGLILTTVLLHVTPNEPWVHLALMTLLCMGFRYLATAHYGVAVAALTGTVVILLSFDGVNPGAAVADRVLNTAFGCTMALLAYVAWPTWERGHARAALAQMLGAYADYLRALVQDEDSHRIRETRNAARRARTNAQASIERLRSEPGTPTPLMNLALALFANGNRLARTLMTLEAMAPDLATAPAQAEIRRFFATAADALQSLVVDVGEQGSANPGPDNRGPDNPGPDNLRPDNRWPDLRMAQRRLVELTANADDRTAAELLARLSDRLVANINSLAYAMNRDLANAPAGNDTAAV